MLPLCDSKTLAILSVTVAVSPTCFAEDFPRQPQKLFSFSQTDYVTRRFNGSSLPREGERAGATLGRRSDSKGITINENEQTTPNQRVENPSSAGNCRNRGCSMCDRRS